MDKPLGKRKYTKKPPAIAYSLSLPFGATLHVKKSANAWWMDQQKVHALTEAFRFRLTIPEACLHAGITVKNYEYFVEVHPQFREAKEGYGLDPDIRAKVTIVKSVNNGDIKAARWWAVHKMRDEFGPPSRRSQRIKDLEFSQRDEPVRYSPEIEEKMRLEERRHALAMQGLIAESRREKSRKQTTKPPVAKVEAYVRGTWDPEEDDDWEERVNAENLLG